MMQSEEALVGGKFLFLNNNCNKEIGVFTELLN